MTTEELGQVIATGVFTTIAKVLDAVPQVLPVAVTDTEE